MIPNKIIIHCTDTENGVRVDIKEILRWHILRGFKEVGYHLVIQPDGEVQYGRKMNEVGAHCQGENANSIGICLAGRDKFTAKAFAALRKQLNEIYVAHQKIPYWELRCHREFDSAIAQGKNCPNMYPTHLLAWYLCMHDRAIAQYLLPGVP